MAIFLTREQIYRTLQRELPEGVYPDGAPSAYFSTAENDSVAKVIGSAYTNLERIYANFFPQTADEKIDDWITKCFAKPLDASLSLAEKRTRVIEKIRKQPSISKWDILTTVASFLPEGVYAQVYHSCSNPNEAWELGISTLGQTTFLGQLNTLPAEAANDYCAFFAGLHWRLGYDKLGVDTVLGEHNYVDVTVPQIAAFLYEIRIFDYELTGLSLENMQEAVHAAEPARSSFRLKQNQMLSDYGLNTTVNNVDKFSGVDTIARDSSQTTGYIGRRM